jgi:hypothetical protein
MYYLCQKLRRARQSPLVINSHTALRKLFYDQEIITSVPTVKNLGTTDRHATT